MNDIMKRILSQLKPFIRQLAILLVLMIISTVVGMLIPAIGKDIMDKGLQENNFDLVLQLSLIGIGLAVLSQLIRLGETKIQATISAFIPFNLKRRAFKHTMKLKMNYFNNTNITELMQNINMDVSQVSMIADKSLFFIITMLFRIAGGIAGLIIFIDWKLTLVLLAFIPIRFFIVKYLAKKRMAMFQQYMTENKDFAQWYGDTLTGVKEIKLWNLEHLKYKDFIDKQRGLMRSNINLSFMDQYHTMSEMLLFDIFNYGILILGAYLMMRENLSIGAIFAFTTYSTQIVGPISAIINIGYHFANILPSAKRLFAFMDIEEEETPPKGEEIIINPAAVEGKFRFENVAFSYNEDKPVLRDISFEILPGEKTAIIGTNGSGKSTILNLLLRIHQQRAGTITLDGKDISRIKLTDYRKLLSVVNQDLYLFNTSIGENITLGRKEVSSTLEEAAKAAQAEDFITALPAGYNSRVGIGGSNLSGGEKQKIALSRAFAGGTNILILDEATSNIDIESERCINEHILSNLPDTTVIMVTHKPDILKQVDKIILIDDGKVSAIGSHDRLYTENETYREIIRKAETSSSSVMLAN